MRPIPRLKPRNRLKALNTLPAGMHATRLETSSLPALCANAPGNHEWQCPDAACILSLPYRGLPEQLLANSVACLLIDHIMGWEQATAMHDTQEHCAMAMRNHTATWICFVAT